MILKYKNKILSAFLALTLLASFNVCFYPNQVNAIGKITASVPTVDIAQTPQTLMEWAKKMAGVILKRAILDRIVAQTVDWIQSDFRKSGRPAFLQNPEAFKKTIIDEAVGTTIESIVPALCKPFQLHVRFGIVNPSTPAQQLTCTSQKINQNFEDFAKDFEGSPTRWFDYAAVSEPQNNYYGMTFMVESLKQNTVAQVVKAQDLSQTINMGFTSVEKCDPESIYNDVPCNEGDDGCNCYTEVTHNPCRDNPSKSCETENLICNRGVETKCKTGIPDCNCKALTPGNFIAQEVFKIGGSDTPKNAILSADDVATYIGTLLDAIISHYTQLGLRGLMGVLYPCDPDEDPECPKPSNKWDLYVRKSFSALDSMTYNNIRTMYVDEIQSVLEIKISSRDKVDALIDTENELKDELAVISSCTLPESSESEQEKLADAKPFVASIIASANSTLDYLDGLETDLKSNIDDMNSVKSEMQNSQYPTDPTDTDGTAEKNASLSLLTGYQGLKEDGILDLDAANKELDSINKLGETIHITAANAHTYDALVISCNNALAAAAAAAATGPED